MKFKWRNIAVGLFTAAVLTGCGGSNSDNNIGGGSPTPTPTPTTKEWLLFADDGSANSNNLTIFKASASPSLQTPIPQQGQTLNFNTLPLGEIHFANGRAFIVVTSGLTGPPPGNLPSGGLAVVDLAHPETFQTVVLASTSTNRLSRIVHAYIDPEGKFLWANNDGANVGTRPAAYDDCYGSPTAPSTAPDICKADSVFRVNVDPASPDYLKVVDIAIGDGHKKLAFGRPSAAQPTAKKVIYISSLPEKRVDVIDDDPASPTYGTVIKTVRKMADFVTQPGNSPHGFDYSPASGRGFTGLTGGGVVSIDGTKLDLNNDGIVDIPDFDCQAHSDCNDGSDPSVHKLTLGEGSNPTLFAGYVKVHTNEHGEDRVYTGGRNSAAAMGWLNVIDPKGGNTPPITIKSIELGDQGIGNVAFAGNKLYVPSGSGGAVKNEVKVIDADHDSPTVNTVLRAITVGLSPGNTHASPDGRLVMAPNTATNTVSVIDVETDAVIDTLTLTTGTTAKNVAMVHLPVDAEDNH